jgi:hypothetical protein
MVVEETLAGARGAVPSYLYTNIVEGSEIFPLLSLDWSRRYQVLSVSVQVEGLVPTTKLRAVGLVSK